MGSLLELFVAKKESFMDQTISFSLLMFSLFVQLSQMLHKIEQGS